MMLSMSRLSSSSSSLSSRPLVALVASASPLWLLIGFADCIPALLSLGKTQAWLTFCSQWLCEPRPLKWWQNLENTGDRKCVSGTHATLPSSRRTLYGPLAMLGVINTPNWPRYLRGSFSILTRVPAGKVAATSSALHLSHKGHSKKARIPTPEDDSRNLTLAPASRDTAPATSTAESTSKDRGSEHVASSREGTSCNFRERIARCMDKMALQSCTLSANSATKPSTTMPMSAVSAPCSAVAARCDDMLLRPSEAACWCY
mmetsp:Transcript_6285/g.15067  ORF Transcript_6285/g.15067 Transcript_6285/m.15067 type:complete len:260 (+) Transcript_6285:170-949(+)